MLDAAQDEATPTASVVQPVPTEQALTLELTGSVRMSEKATVTSEVTGRVAWVSPEFKNGGTLAAHESIVRIDSTEFELPRASGAEGGRGGRGSGVDGKSERRGGGQSLLGGKTRAKKHPTGYAGCRR